MTLLLMITPAWNNNVIKQLLWWFVGSTGEGAPRYFWNQSWHASRKRPPCWDLKSEQKLVSRPGKQREERSKQREVYAKKLKIKRAQNVLETKSSSALLETKLKVIGDDRITGGQIDKYKSLRFTP